MNDRINSLISEYGKTDSFSHYVPTKELLDAAQEQLGVRLPDQYVDFLKQYGDGGFNGFEVSGVGNGRAFFVEDTLDYRQYGLPANLLVLEDCDEWLYCLDCDTGEVVSWDQGGEASVDYATFDDYLLDRIGDAIDNL